MSDPIIDRLDQIKGRAEKAMPGPWAPIWEEGDEWWVIYGAPHYDGGYYRLCPEVAIIEGDSSGSDDAEFIAAARTDVEQMEAALRAVLGLHRTSATFKRWTGFPRADHPERYCPIDQQAWPCPTYRAVADALGVDIEGEER